MSQPEQELTQHAMLVLWGQFAQRIGLIKKLEAIPLHQKTYTHQPQTKVLEFFVAILAGLPHLKDISRSAHPLDQDQAVARAWGKPAWADYSGVSRTLHALTLGEAHQIVQLLDTLSQPFIDREVNQAYLNAGALTLDFDLTGRPVSNTSVSYPDVAFGYMGDQVQLGYQAAMASMHSPTYGRLWLSTALHPGDTVSCTQVAALVSAAEAKTGVRPWRRTEMLAQRLAQLEQQANAAEKDCQQAQKTLAHAQQKQRETTQKAQHWQEQVHQLEVAYQLRQRPERPHSWLAKARRRLTVQQRRQGRRDAAVQKIERRLERRGTRWQQLQEAYTLLQQRQQQFEHDNASNPMPMPMTVRIDAGFGTSENIALLIELGYQVYSKPQSHWVTRKLKQEAATRTDWVRVGANAEMIAWSEKGLSRYPYPLDVAVERFHTGQNVRHSTLLHYGDQPVTTDLSGWFQQYNGRQTIEAGIKEGKGVFEMHHLKVRAEAGLFLQEHFAAFAANFVRWAAHWLFTQCPSASAESTPMSESGVKEMVQVAAHTSAWVIWQPHGCLLKFTKASVYAGQSVQADKEWAFQLPLPLFKSYVFAPT
jgi:hypothetical protein